VAEPVRTGTPAAGVPGDAPDVCPAAGYDLADIARWVWEPPKTATRSPFERDRARVLHSAALRRLGAKTQIHGPGSDDFVRTRLTHTHEVAQVGRELGKALGCDPDVVDTACLAHDLGHPPFGHNGEQALAIAAVDVGGFEGNAQTLRLLTRLEAKSFMPGPDGRSVGLNLTRASLDAATKYPWPPGGGHDPTSSKFGVYADDADVFDWLRAGAPAGRRCLEAEVMDFADDVAYSVHDVEDALATRRLRLDSLGDDGVRHDVWAIARDWYDPAAGDDSLDEAWKRLRDFGYWPTGADFGGSRRELAALKDMTSQLIGRFCVSAQASTRRVFGDGPLTRYAAGLVTTDETRMEIVVLKALAAHFVMDTSQRRGVQLGERQLLSDLVGALVERPEELEREFADDLSEAADEGARLRVVLDQVASLTDVSARVLHARLVSRPAD
jgi:dGTPase